MLEEYFIWKKIFEDAGDLEMENLIKLVIMDENARSYVFDKIFKININVDKNLKEFPIELLASKISNDIIEKINDIEIKDDTK